MKTFGLEKHQWKTVENIVLEPLNKKNTQLFVFGSRARNDHKKFSDLDILIRGKIDDITLSNIKENLENSNLPITVDLVLEKDLAESYKETILKEMLPV